MLSKLARIGKVILCIILIVLIATVVSVAINMLPAICQAYLLGLLLVGFAIVIYNLLGENDE